MPGGAPLPQVRPPQQARSRAVMDRVLQATAELLAERGFPALTVAAVVERAECSTGSFYARFADKEAVISTLEQGMRTQALASADAQLARDRWEGKGALEVVRGWIGPLAQVDPSTLAVVRAFTVRSLLDPAARPTHLAHRQEILDRYLGGLRDRLLERRAEVHHPDPEHAIALAFHLVNAATEQRLIFGEASWFSQSSRRRFVNDLVATAASTLRIQN